MPRITKVLNMDNRGTYALVRVMVGQEEAVVIVGGSVELYHSDRYDTTQAFIKKGVRSETNLLAKADKRK